MSMTDSQAEPVLQTLAAPRPAHVVLGVNNFCNLHCVMCDVGTGNGDTNFGANLTGAKTRSMPMELFRLVADDMAGFCPDARLGFAFTEPLAWKPLGEALAYASSLGLFATVTTNGLLLPRRAAELAGGRCRELFVSLDGPAAIHDDIRRHIGSFARAVDGIRLISALPGAPEISVFCTISEYNVGYLGQFLCEIRDLPLKRVGFIHNNFVTPAQADQHNIAFGGTFDATASNTFQSDPARIDVERLAGELSEIKASVYPFNVAVQPDIISSAGLNTYYRHPEIFIGNRCNDAGRILMIDADGESIPVHGRCYRFPIANIRDVGLSRLWVHESIVSLRRALADAGGLLPACSRCCGGFGRSPPEMRTTV